MTSFVPTGFIDCATKSAVVVVSHGSRRAESARMLDAQVNRMQELLGPCTLVRAASMSLEDHALTDVLQELVDQADVTHIIVIPFFLVAGVHFSQDIPRMLADWQSNNPQVSISLGQPLGLDLRLAQMMADQAEMLLQKQLEHQAYKN